MTVEELSDGLIAKSVPERHLESLREDVKEHDDVLAVFDNAEEDTVTVLISIAHLTPNIQYIH